MEITNASKLQTCKGKPATGNLSYSLITGSKMTWHQNDQFREKKKLKDLSFEEKVKGVKKNGRRREVQVRKREMQSQEPLFLWNVGATFTL